MMYKECPYCGLNLDPGEQCDCATVQSINRMRKRQAENYRQAEMEEIYEEN